jgi:hypothetical protein
VPIRRTTLAAEQEDLAVVEADARRRGVSLASALRDIVAREAGALRSQSRPRFGVGRSDQGAATAATQDETAPVRRRPASRWP